MFALKIHIKVNQDEPKILIVGQVPVGKCVLVNNQFRIQDPEELKSVWTRKMTINLD